MWTNNPPPTHNAATECSGMFSVLKGALRLAQPKLRTVGQCFFGIAMVFMLTGIALCIWGYVGTAIKPFQISGPVCIGVGMIIYIIGCILCCREYPSYESMLKDRERQEKTKRAVKHLQRQDIIEYIQGEPELLEEFRNISSKILNHQGLYATSGNVIANLYVNQLCQDT